jgi:hypothetical protein
VLLGFSVDPILLSVLSRVSDAPQLGGINKGHFYKLKSRRNTLLQQKNFALPIKHRRGRNFFTAPSLA